MASDSEKLDVDNDIVGETLSHYKLDLSDKHGVISTHLVTLQVIATQRLSTMTLLVKHQVIMSQTSRISMGWISNYPLSDIASDSDTLNVANDIVGETPSHHKPDLSD